MGLIELRSLLAEQVLTGLAGMLSNPPDRQVEALAETAAEAAKALPEGLWKVSEADARNPGTPSRQYNPKRRRVAEAPMSLLYAPESIVCLDTP